MDNWKRTVGKYGPLRNCLTTYARKLGGVSMEHIVWDKGSRFYKLGQSMDKIGWRRYMEGMISLEALAIQAECVDLGGCSLLLDNWVKGLAIKLLEATHG